MLNPEEKIIALLKKHGVNFTASLPCEKVKTLLEMVEMDFYHVPLTREEEGVGIAAGAALTGRRPALFVQSSGIGNMINALLSLTAFYELPLALFVSRRGVYKEKIEAQFPMGRRLPGILTGAGISYSEINTVEDINIVDRELPEAFIKNKIHAFLLSPAIWEGSVSGAREAKSMVQETKDARHDSMPTRHHPLAPMLTRYDILKLIASFIDNKVTVCNLGIPSKELYAVKHQPSNFYMLGSMGMVTPVGLGIALTSKKEVFVIEGDGSLLMNPGTLATAAALAPSNLTIITIDNAAYGSTGNQPTLAGACVDLEHVALGFGFRNTVKIAAPQEIVDVMRKPRQDLSFIHVIARVGNKDVPNIPIHHLAIKKAFQDFLAR